MKNMQLEIDVDDLDRASQEIWDRLLKEYFPILLGKKTGTLQ